MRTLKTITVVCALLLSAGAKAETKFIDNTYAGLSGRLSTSLVMSKLLPVEGDVSVRLGKWVTPALGFNLEETLGFGTPSLWLYYFTKNVVRTNNLGMNVDVDIIQAVRYKEDRWFTVMAEAGLGWLHGFGDSTVDDMSAKTGAIVAFNLGKDRAWQLFVEPEIIWNLTNGGSRPKFNKQNGQLGLEVGVVYRFRTKWE